MKKIKKKKTISNIFPIFLMFMAVFIGTAFANIDNITGTIEAHAESPLQDGVFISDITEAYSSGLEGTQINTYSKRMISSKIILNSEDTTSEVVYNVKLYNNTDYIYKVTGISYDEKFYDNTNIVVGTQEGTILQPKQETTIDLIFAWVDGKMSSDNELNSYINIDVKLLDPEVTIESNAASYCQSTDLKITVTDKSLVGLASTNSYQYYLSSSSNTLEGGEWTDYESGVTQRIGEGLNGEYCLFIRQIYDTQGNAGVATGKQVVDASDGSGKCYWFGPYWFDNKVAKPTVETYFSKTSDSTSSYTAGTWTNKTVYGEVTGVEESDFSGIAKYQISTDNKTWIDYSWDSSVEPYKISTAGTTYRYYRAVDNVGNVSEVVTKTFKIDTSVPTIAVSGSVSATIATAATMTVSSAADTGGSGIAKIIWYWKLSTETSYKTLRTNSYHDMNTTDASTTTSVSSMSNALSLSPSTTYNLRADVYDVAGNVKSATTSITLKAAIAQYGSTKYTSIANALNATNSGTITVLANTTESFTVSSAKSITLNLNGKTVTSKTSSIVNQGTLVIEGNGSIYGQVPSGHAISNPGTLTLKNGTIQSNTRGAIWNANKFNMSGGTVAYYGSDANWAAVDSRGTSNYVSITGGTVKATSAGRAIFLQNGSGQHWISNTTISANTGWALYTTDTAKASVTGCTFTGTYGIYRQYYGNNTSIGNANTSYNGAEDLVVMNCSIPSATKIRGYVMEVVAIGGGYQTRMYDSINSTPSAKFYTWTSTNGQDDMKVYNGTKMTLHDSIVFACNTLKSQHNNESGVYNTHIYTESADSSGGGSGNFYFFGGHQYTL